MVSSTVTPTSSTLNAQFPVAAIVIIAVGGYLVIMLIILSVRQCLTARGICVTESGKSCCADNETCEKRCTEFCLMSCCDCQSPNCTACIDAMCPKRRNMNFTDVVTCQACARRCCNDGCQCGSCNCNCNCDCQNINCLCFECKSADNMPEDQ